MPKITNSVIRQLQLVFSLSTLLLLISLVASYFSIQKLIGNADLVNYTNQVLIEAENIISYMKDAETGQRGYVITRDPLFLQPYTGSYQKVKHSYDRLLSLTADNLAQQKNLVQAKGLYEAKFAQMQRIINLTSRSQNVGRDTTQRHREMLRGKQIMDDLRVVINQIKTSETKLLQDRTQQLELYSNYTPILLVIAALISMLITAFTYVRIRKNMDDRLKQQREAEATYTETARRITVLEGVTRQIADGDYTVRSTDIQDDEMGRVVTALNKMTVSLEETFVDLQNKNWLQAGSANVSDAIRGEKDIRILANRVLETLADYLDAPVGAIYIADEVNQFVLAGSYATQQAPNKVISGEGLVGQAIARKKTTVISNVPLDYSRISSSVGNTSPAALIIAPLVYNNVCLGAIELGLLRTPNAQETAFIDTNREAIAIGINAALDYVRLERLLEETQAQSEELQAQHEEMETMNAELETQTQKLQASEEELRVQQEELQQTNAELEERGMLLEERNNDIQQKADELEVATRYKSEFLANMSHELRTPLNSILLLSRLLAENTDETLNGEQVEYAQVIQSSGNGLLGLIDEILDLSKIEAGQMNLENEPVAISEITDELQGLFGVLANQKELAFSITVEPDVPTTIETDKMRLGQILKNLISNAVKFTATGQVTLTVRKQDNQDGQLSFVVADTGIGIPIEKQPLIFEAFQQADGSTKRKYGGTGLGLSISRELAKLLGGQITLKSTVNQGSEFNLHLPLSGGMAIMPVEKTVVQPVHFSANPVSSEPVTNKYLSTTIPEAIPDDRNTITNEDKVILIIEDDTNFAKALLDYAHTKGYKGIVAVRGDEGPTLAATFKPTGILLDVQLPVMSGWDVMDALKANPQTRPIPVHMMSSHKVKNESRMKGAIDFVDKPMAFEQMQDVFKKIEYVLNGDTKKVLIVEDNPRHAKALAYFLETFNIRSELKSDIGEGIDALKRNDLECVILDMGVPDSKAYETLETVKKNPGLENLPIIIFTGKSLSMAEELKIKKYADSIIVKTAHSYQRMLDEVSLFLHLVEENKPASDKAIPKKLRGLNQVLTGKTVLVADDDVRNIFALSKALEQYNMTVVAALDGKEALEKLADNPGVDVVLLDMMMPQMDGYETAKKIREHYQWKKLPIIAVTAKAMTGDRERCIQAGASDYITKPVDIDQLISLLRVWLYDAN